MSCLIVLSQDSEFSLNGVASPTVNVDSREYWNGIAVQSVFKVTICYYIFCMQLMVTSIIYYMFEFVFIKKT